MPLWITPSFQCTVHGDVPVSAAWIVVELPAQMAALPVTVAVARGVTGIVTDPLLLQPFSVTVTSSCAGDAVPTEKTMAFVPAPDVIVPFAIVQEYVAPAPAFGTEAARPLAFWQAAAGAAIVAEGTGVTVTVAPPVPAPTQFASATVVTEYVVVDDGETDRVAGLDAIPLCTKPSAQFSVQGPVPVRATESGAELPSQIPAVPLTAAVGAVEPHVYVKLPGSVAKPLSGFVTATSTTAATCGPVVASI